MLSEAGDPMSIQIPELPRNIWASGVLPFQAGQVACSLPSLRKPVEVFPLLLPPNVQSCTLPETLLILSIIINDYLASPIP